MPSCASPRAKVYTGKPKMSIDYALSAIKEILWHRVPLVIGSHAAEVM
jgi:hypothetical protein